MEYAKENKRLVNAIFHLKKPVKMCIIKQFAVLHQEHS